MASVTVTHMFNKASGPACFPAGPQRLCVNWEGGGYGVSEGSSEED